MSLLLDLCSVVSGAYAGYRYRAWKGPNVVRHEHLWEVLEQTPIRGTSLDDAIKAAKASSYAVPMDEIMEHIRPPGAIVKRRCTLCLTEEVVRV